MNTKISIIAAIGKNRELGKNNKLLFQIPEDMKFFREKTRGHTVIMGRKTYESIGHPLPNRNNIIITRDVSKFIKSHPEFARPEQDRRVSGSSIDSGSEAGMTHLRASFAEVATKAEQGFGGQGNGVVVSSIEEALEFAKAVESPPAGGEIFVIGGAQIYELALPYADKLYLTLVDAEVKDADAFFPDYSEFKTTVSERKSSDENYVYNFLEITRSS